MKDRILIKRNILRINGELNENAAAYGAKLLNQFGIVVDKPKYLSPANLKTVSEFYGVDIPEGFYKNPQHLQYFTSDELLTEQIISYFTVAICGEESLNEEVFTRKPIFSKALPNYEEGKEVKVRYYRMLTYVECDKVLSEITASLCQYTRSWSLEESSEFKWLYLNGYYHGDVLRCKDNAIEMFLEYKNKSFAQMLDKKDVVKMSVGLFGERRLLDLSDNEQTVFSIAVENAKNCPLTKKQAKYFNAIVRNVKINAPQATNEASAYKLALSKLKAGDVVGAAQVFASNGSLLERNVVFLLSRANTDEARQILDMLKSTNPIVLIQLLYGINADDRKNKRVFKFIANRKFKMHTETDNEFAHRKSVLNPEIRAMLIQSLYAKIREYYSNMPSLGKIYVSEQFKKIALPLNTAAMGMGLDVLPTGSRLPMRGEFVRTFCYWRKAFDIDASVTFITDNGEYVCLYWGNYSQKMFGNNVLFSGDDRSANGAEYCDIKTSEVRKLGYRYAVYCLNGYCDTLDQGEIYCGYQDKANLKTKAWSPKNIEFKIRVKGKTRSYIGFALDLETRETVVLNRLLNCDCQTIDVRTMDNVLCFLDSGYLDVFNLYMLLSMRGELVANPEDAEVVFDADYLPRENQKVIRPFNIEQLVNLLK